jgi:hypothetical protein
MDDRTCERCGKSFKYPSILKKHLARKTPCGAGVVARSKTSTHSCDRCGNVYAYASGLSRHNKESCRPSTECGLSPRLSNEMQLIELRREVADLRRNLQQHQSAATLMAVGKADHAVMGDNASMHVAGRDQINLNFFGHEDTSHMNKAVVREILAEASLAAEDPELAANQAFIQTAMRIFSNLDKPENINCYLVDTKRDEALVFGPTGWEIVPYTDVAPGIAKASCDVLMEHQPTDAASDEGRKCGKVVREVFNRETAFGRGDVLRPVMVRNKSLKPK